MKRSWILALAALILAGAAVGYTLRSDSSAAGALGPKETVQAYYDWYLDYVGDRATGEFRNAMVDGAYRASPYLSSEFIAEVDALIAGFEGGGYDPFLMAQDVPTDINVGEAMIAEGTATVPVTTSFAGHSFEVTLEQATDGTWLITAINRSL